MFNFYIWCFIFHFICEVRCEQLVFQSTHLKYSFTLGASPECYISSKTPDSSQPLKIQFRFQDAMNFNIFFNNATLRKASSSFSLSIQDQSSCSILSWENIDTSKLVPEDCFSATYWYGGPEIYSQHFASGKGTGNTYKMQPFQFSDILFHRERLGGASKPIWYNSDGWSVSVESSLSYLWTSYNDTTSLDPSHHNSLCFLANVSNSKSSSSMVGNVFLRYEVCHHPSPVEAWSSAPFKSLLKTYDSKALPFDSYMNTVWHVDSLLSSGTGCTCN